jgi:hypothetical protein
LTAATRRRIRGARCALSLVPISGAQPARWKPLLQPDPDYCSGAGVHQTQCTPPCRSHRLDLTFAIPKLFSFAEPESFVFDEPQKVQGKCAFFKTFSERAGGSGWTAIDLDRNGPLIRGDNRFRNIERPRIITLSGSLITQPRNQSPGCAPDERFRCPDVFYRNGRYEMKRGLLRLLLRSRRCVRLSIPVSPAFLRSSVSTGPPRRRRSRRQHSRIRQTHLRIVSCDSSDR